MTVNTDDCWLWARRLDVGGYGRFRWRGRDYLAHKFMFIAYKGEVPEGLEVDHICNVRLCVNPNHLQLLTHAENTRKRFKPNCCNRGHELTKDNVYTWKENGTLHRQCRLCNVRGSARRRLKQKERVQ